MGFMCYNSKEDAISVNFLGTKKASKFIILKIL